MAAVAACSAPLVGAPAPTPAATRAAGLLDRVHGSLYQRAITAQPGDHYIGRPSPLGNPFVIGRDGTRAEVKPQGH
ncbi:DUF4326 domain-containing protein [Candidatus Chloroploca sp. Khr17]|uniref:DUF4326 domain-containing protein n=1 Tax=Candidatus Chloroploca sp. Khr17 TaxID=2496869 RepID=UPI00101B5C18|nr:DUF4326 domain-containing protein [Candidatus Chloroploca sp. Khr17]